MELLIGFHDDCVFLLINGEDVAKFDHSITCLDPHIFTKLTGETDAGDPVCQSHRFSLEQKFHPDGLVSYKKGSSSDLTMGRLVKIDDYPPKGWYGVDEGEDDDLNSIVFERDNDNEDGGDEEKFKDYNEWLGLVRWYGAVPFAAPGDSGRMYAKVRYIDIPLGIHVGCPSSIPDHSVFFSTGTFVLKAERESLDPPFTK